MSVQGRWADVLRRFLQQNGRLDDFGDGDQAEEEEEEEEELVDEHVACSSLPSDAADSVTPSELDEMLSNNRDLVDAEEVSLTGPANRSGLFSPRFTASASVSSATNSPGGGDTTTETAAQRRRRGLEEKIAKFNELQQRRREIQRLRSTENLVDALPKDYDEDNHTGGGFIEIFDTRRRNLPLSDADRPPSASPLPTDQRRRRRHRDQRRHSTLSTISSDDESAMRRYSEYEPGPGVYTEPPSRQNVHIQMHPNLRSSFEQLYEAGFGSTVVGFGPIDVLNDDWMEEEEEEEEMSSSSAASFVRLPAKLRKSDSSGEATPQALDSGAEVETLEEEEEEEQKEVSILRQHREKFERPDDRPIFPGAAGFGRTVPQPPKRRSLPSVEEAEARRKGRGGRQEKAAIFSSKIPKLGTASSGDNLQSPAAKDDKFRARMASNGAKFEEKAHTSSKTPLTNPSNVAGRSPSTSSTAFAELRNSFESASASQPSSDTESGHSFIHRPSVGRSPGDKEVEAVEEEEEEEAEEETDPNRLHTRFYAWTHSRPQHELDTIEIMRGGRSFGMDVQLCGKRPTHRSSLELKMDGGNKEEAEEAAESPVVAKTRSADSQLQQQPKLNAHLSGPAFNAFVGLLEEQESSRVVPPLDLGSDSSDTDRQQEKAQEEDVVPRKADEERRASPEKQRQAWVKLEPPRRSPKFDEKGSSPSGDSEGRAEGRVKQHGGFLRIGSRGRSLECDSSEEDEKKAGEKVPPRRAKPRRQRRRREEAGSSFSSSADESGSNVHAERFRHPREELSASDRLFGVGESVRRGTPGYVGLRMGQPGLAGRSAGDSDEVNRRKSGQESSLSMSQNGPQRRAWFEGKQQDELEPSTVKGEDSASRHPDRMLRMQNRSFGASVDREESQDVAVQELPEKLSQASGMMASPGHDYWIKDRRHPGGITEQIRRLETRETDIKEKTSSTRGDLGQPGMSRTELGQPGMSRTELGQPGMSRMELSQPGMSRIELGQPGMSRTELGQPGMSRAELDQRGMYRAEIGGSGTGRLELGHASPDKSQVSVHAPRREISDPPPLPPRQDHSHMAKSPSFPDQVLRQQHGDAVLHSPPHELRQLLHGRPQGSVHKGQENGVYLGEEQWSYVEAQRGVPTQASKPLEQWQGRPGNHHVQQGQSQPPSSSGQVWPAGVNAHGDVRSGQARPSSQNQSYIARPANASHGGYGNEFNGIPAGQVSRGNPMWPHEPLQGQMKRVESLQDRPPSGQQRQNQVRFGSFNGQIRPNDRFQGQMQAGEQYQGQLRSGQQLPSQMQSIEQIPGHSGQYQGQMRLGDPHQGQMQAGYHLQGQMRPGDPHQGQMQAGHHLQGQMRSDDPRQGQMQTEHHLQGQLRPGDPRQGHVQTGHHLQGQLRLGDPRQGQMQTGDYLQGQMRPGDPRQSQMQTGDHLQGQMRPADARQGQMRPGDSRQDQMQTGGHLQGQMRPGDPRQGQMQYGAQLQGQLRSGIQIQSQIRVGAQFQGQMRTDNQFQGQLRPDDQLRGQKRTGSQFQNQGRSGDHIQGHLQLANQFQGQMMPGNHLQSQRSGADQLQVQMQLGNPFQGQARLGDQLQGQMRPRDQLHGQMRPGDQLQGQTRPANQLQGQTRPGNQLQGQTRPDDQLQGQMWPHERFQARMAREVGGTPLPSSSQGPVVRSNDRAHHQDLRSASFNEGDLQLHPRRAANRRRQRPGVSPDPACVSAPLQRHHSTAGVAPVTATLASTTATAPPPPPPLPPRQRATSPTQVTPSLTAPLERLRTAFEEADRKVRAAGGEEEDEEAHREDFWRQMASMERQERAGFAWDDDEDAWVTNAVKEEPWTILKDPGDINDPVAELERMYLDLDLDRDDLLEKAERRIVPDQVFDRLKQLKDEATDDIGPLSPSALPLASPTLPGATSATPSGCSTLRSNASTTRSYNHIPHRAPFPHRLRDDKAFRRLHPNVQAPTLPRKSASFNSGATSAFISGVATPAEMTAEEAKRISEGKPIIRAASSVRTRAEPSPTTADYLLPRESGTLERRKQWPPPFAEDPDLKVDDMAFRRLVKPTQAAKPQKDLLGKPRPTPFTENEDSTESGSKVGGKQTWWPYARVHEMKRQGFHQDVEELSSTPPPDAFDLITEVGPLFHSPLLTSAGLLAAPSVSTRSPRQFPASEAPGDNAAPGDEASPGAHVSLALPVHIALNRPQPGAYHFNLPMRAHLYLAPDLRVVPGRTRLSIGDGEATASSGAEVRDGETSIKIIA